MGDGIWVNLANVTNIDKLSYKTNCTANQYLILPLKCIQLTVINIISTPCSSTSIYYKSL